MHQSHNNAMIAMVQQKELAMILHEPRDVLTRRLDTF